MLNIRKLALASSLILITSSVIAVTPLNSESDSSGSKSSSSRGGVTPLNSNPSPSSSLSQDSSGLQFPNSPEGIRAALKLDKSNGQLRSKTRSLAELQSIRVGALVEFEFGSARIIPTVELKNFGEAFFDLEDGIKVEIAGHTDNVGNDSANRSLSVSRAEAVKRHLVEEYNVASNALVVRGYGESRPIESNRSNEGRQRNRRVEFARIFE